MKFKVGDRVRLVKISESEKRSLSEKKYINALNKIFTIKSIHDDNWASLKEANINPYLSDLELVSEQFTKSDLKDGDIVTYRSGEKRYVDATKQEIVYIDNHHCLSFRFDNFNEDLTDIEENTKYDIIKVERPTGYETIFKRKEEILDETEKRYLRDVIRPFRKTVRYIEKEDNGQISRIKICFDYHFMFFPTLEKEKRMYEGMKANRAYSIKELGL